VHESIFDKVVEKVAASFSAKKIGNADNKETEIGPLVAKRQLELLASQVEDAKAKGAKIVTGGNSLEGKLGGAFFEPTVITDVTSDMRVWNEEVAKQIESGMVSINGTNYIMPFNPFGGYKNSGFGREHGKYGFHEVTQIKIVATNK
jgi:acyl-CoA reductase-like NAD-dependent aldehyde dehydrogenase